MSTATIDISRAEIIAGWMSIPELEWLAQEASKHQRIVELGCFLGRSTRVLADHCPGTVYAIDRWIPMPYMQGMSTNTDIWGTFQRNMRDHLNSGKVRPIRAEHDDYALFPVEWLRATDQSLRPDMVFIDGGHLYEEVKRDILAWKERIAPGGLLCGHDANNASWPGVEEALAQVLPSAKRVPDTQHWYWEAPCR